ncbi:uncharacterized protein LOC144435349 [Glandiceps talaboti]
MGLQVFYGRGPGRYLLNFYEAVEFCKVYGTRIATYDELFTAWEAGFQMCEPGWLQDVSVRYPMQEFDPMCGRRIGIVNWGYRLKSETFAVYCYSGTSVFPNYVMTCSNWFDENNGLVTPQVDSNNNTVELTFEMGTNSVNVEMETVWKFLYSYNNSTSPPFYLAPGLEEVSIRIIDVFGMFSTFEVNVQVKGLDLSSVQSTQEVLSHLLPDGNVPEEVLDMENKRLTFHNLNVLSEIINSLMEEVNKESKEDIQQSKLAMVETVTMFSTGLSDLGETEVVAQVIESLTEFKPPCEMTAQFRQRVTSTITLLTSTMINQAETMTSSNAERIVKDMVTASANVLQSSSSSVDENDEHYSQEGRIDSSYNLTNVIDTILDLALSLLSPEGESMIIQTDFLGVILLKGNQTGIFGQSFATNHAGITLPHTNDSDSTHGMSLKVLSYQSNPFPRNDNVPFRTSPVLVAELFDGEHSSVKLDEGVRFTIKKPAKVFGSNGNKFNISSKLPAVFDVNYTNVTVQATTMAITVDVTNVNATYSMYIQPNSTTMNETLLDQEFNLKGEFPQVAVYDGIITGDTRFFFIISVDSGVASGPESSPEPDLPQDPDDESNSRDLPKPESTPPPSQIWSDESWKELLLFYRNGTFHVPQNYTFPLGISPGDLENVQLANNYDLMFDNHEWHDAAVDDGIHDMMSDEMLHGMLANLPEGLRAKLELTGLLPNLDEISHLSFEEMIALPESIVKRLNHDFIERVSAEEAIALLMFAGESSEAIYHLFGYFSTAVFEETLILAEEIIQERGPPPKEYNYAVVSAFERHFGRPRTWDAADIDLLLPFINGLNPEIIKSLNREAFNEIMSTIESGEFEPEGPNRRATIHAAMRHWGRVPYWDAEKLLMFGDLTKDMTPNELRQISPAIIMDILPMISQHDFQHARGRVLMDVVLESPEWEWSAEQVKGLGNLTKFLHGNEIRNLPSSVIAEAGDNLVESVEGRGSQVRNLAAKVAESLGNVRDWKSEDIKKLGRAASGLKVTDLRELPPREVAKAVTKLAQSDFSKRQRHVIMERFKEGRNETEKPISAKEVKQLGNLVAGLKTSDFKKMNAEDIQESLSTLREASQKMGRTQKFEIINKLKHSKGGVAEKIVEMGSLAREIPLKSLENVSMANMGWDMTDDEGNMTNSDEPPVSGAGKIPWSRGQSMKLFREVVKKDMYEGGLETVSADDISFMGTLALGMTCKDIDGLFDDSILSIASSMMKQSGWTDRQLSCLADKIRRSMTKDNQNFTATFTDSDVVLLTGQLLKKFSLEEISNIPAEEREIAYTSIGQEKLDDVKAEKRRKLASQVLLDRGKDTVDTEIDSEDMDVLGCMMCDLQPTDLERLTSDAFSNVLYDMQTCCLSTEQRDTARQHIENNLGETSTWQSTDIVSVGTLMTTFGNETANIDQTEFAVVAEEIMAEFAGFRDSTEECARELKELDETTGDDAEAFRSVAISAKHALVEDAQSQSPARKKRATYSPTCDEIEILGEGNVAWTIEELTAMDTVEFDNCAETLGQVESFSGEQLDALLEKAKESWGPANDMIPTEIQQLGRIASRFSVSEIMQLNLTDNDAVYSIAIYDDWTPEQLTAAFESYLALNGGSTDSFDGAILVALANFVCGMSAAHISSLPSSSYGEAAASVGELLNCDTTRWTAFKSHAVSEYGEISSWQPEVFAEIGSVIAGFTASELGSLSNITLAGVKPHAVSLIDPETFANAFSVYLLRSFDQQQAEAVTEEQRAALSSDQSDALYYAEYGSTSSEPTRSPDSDNKVTGGAGEVTSQVDTVKLFIAVIVIQTTLDIILRL